VTAVAAAVPTVLGAVSPTVFAAFAAGLLSFVSPCVLPLVPGYLSAVSGLRPGTPQEERDLPAILWPALTFCLSFTVIFVALGMFATGLGAPLADHRNLLNKVAGGFLILFGALVIFSRFFGFMNREYRPGGLIERAGTGGPVIAGAAFAIAWTPCTGPILGAILTTAAQKDGVGGGAFLLASYSAGLAIPFLLSAVAFDRFATGFRWMRDHYTVITVVSGVVLVAVGILVFDNQMTRLAAEARSALDSAGINTGVFER
jgi:cytochrome c-type biogenesis protein